MNIPSFVKSFFISYEISSEYIGKKIIFSKIYLLVLFSFCFFKDSSIFFEFDFFKIILLKKFKKYKKYFLLNIIGVNLEILNL